MRRMYEIRRSPSGLVWQVLNMNGAVLNHFCITYRDALDWIEERDRNEQVRREQQ